MVKLYANYYGHRSVEGSHRGYVFRMTAGLPIPSSASLPGVDGTPGASAAFVCEEVQRTLGIVMRKENTR